MVSINMYKKSDKRTLLDLNSNHLKALLYHLSVILQTYCSVLLNQKESDLTKMILFSVICYTFILTSESMPTDIRSAFANMLHHTLFGPEIEKNGPVKGLFKDIQMDYRRPVKLIIVD